MLPLPYPECHPSLGFPIQDCRDVEAYTSAGESRAGEGGHRRLFPSPAQPSPQAESVLLHVFFHPTTHRHPLITPVLPPPPALHHQPCTPRFFHTSALTNHPPSHSSLTDHPSSHSSLIIPLHPPSPLISFVARHNAGQPSLRVTMSVPWLRQASP